MEWQRNSGLSVRPDPLHPTPSIPRPWPSVHQISGWGVPFWAVWHCFGGVSGFCYAEGPPVPHCHPRHAWPTTVLSEYQEISEQFLWVSATGRETLTLNSSPLPQGDQIAAKDRKGLASLGGFVNQRRISSPHFGFQAWCLLKLQFS